MLDILRKTTARNTHAMRTSSPAPSGSLVHARDVQYLGAFRTPEGQFGGNGSFDFSQGTMAYNPNNDSLFFVGHASFQEMCEISIPAPTLGSNIASFNTCSVLQNFYRLYGRIPNWTLAGRDIRIGGILVKPDNTMIVSVYDDYDGGGGAVGSHFTLDSLTLATANAGGLYQVGPSYAGIVGGYMSPVPASLRASLGWPYITGQCSLAILFRTSSGPCMVGFDPADFGPSTLAGVGNTPAGYYVYYPSDHLLGTYSGAPADPLWGGTAICHSVVFVEGTRTVLYFGVAPGNYKGYGFGSTFNDPTSPLDKGPRTMNGEYIYQCWAYDLNDILLAKAGTIQSWEVLPYDAWDFTLPFSTNPQVTYLTGSAYDPATGRIFVTLYNADQISGPDSRKALVLVFQVPSVATTPAAPEIGHLAVTDTVTYDSGEVSGIVPFCNPIPVGDPVYLTAGNVYPVTAGASITSVAFYLGATFLGNGTPNAGNASHNWVLTPVSTVGLATGSHAISAIATDSNGLTSLACAGAIVVT